MSLFIGSAVALVTPFDVNGVNTDCLRTMIDFHLREGTSALVICGTTGEPSTMSTEEKTAIIEHTVAQVNGRIPVIVGTGSNSTSQTIDDSILAKDLGADALLIVTPYYNKCNQQGLVEHYTSVAEHVDLPIILYNVPARTGVNIDPETVLELSKVKNIVGIKEASANISQIVEVARLCPHMDLYSGNDDHIMPLLALGYKGVISVVANIAPRLTSELVSSYFNGNVIKSREIQMTINPLVKALFLDVNPIPVKTAMHMIGFDVGSLRLPLTELSEDKAKILKSEIQKIGLI